jgi:hypothetical protein
MRELVIYSKLYAASIDICNHHRTSTGDLRHGRDEQAYGSGAEDEDCGAGG